MAKYLLRSGKLGNFQALGEDGQTVFNSALQIRETLRLRGLSAIANCLAIPQGHDENDQIDWYAPVKGTPVTWMNSSLEEQKHALELLKLYQVQLEDIQIHTRQKNNAALKLFSTLVKHVLHCPGKSCIWLINGHPVLAFWGFSQPLRKNAQSFIEEVSQEITYNETPLLSSLPVAEHVTDTEPKINNSEILETISYPPQAIDTSTAPEDIHQEVISKKKSFMVTKLLMFALMFTVPVILLTFIIFSIHTKHYTGSNSQVPSSEYEPLNSEQNKKFASSLPLQQASVIELSPQPGVQVKTPSLDIDQNALILYPNSIRAGSTRFLYGNWYGHLRLDPGQTEALTSFNLNITAGKALITAKADKRTCQTTMQIGLLPSGTLSMKSRSRARCQDGSTLLIPDVSCISGVNDVAICRARKGDIEFATVKFSKLKG